MQDGFRSCSKPAPTSLGLASRLISWSDLIDNSLRAQNDRYCRRTEVQGLVFTSTTLFSLSERSRRISSLNQSDHAGRANILIILHRSVIGIWNFCLDSRTCCGTSDNVFTPVRACSNLPPSPQGPEVSRRPLLWSGESLTVVAFCPSVLSLAD